MLAILPNQLFDIKYLPKDIKKITLIEEPVYFGEREQKMNFNKLKLILHRASMKYYQYYLKKKKYNVKYIDINKINYQEIFSNNITMFRPHDYLLEDKLKKYKITYLNNPNFLMSEEQLNKYYQKNKNKKTAKHVDFYKFVKQELDILVNKKSYDQVNREPLPKNIKLPNQPKQKENKYVREAKIYINELFPNNYGNVEDFIYPITHNDSIKWLRQFIKERLEKFGKYQDAIDSEHPFLFHSIISPMLNIGLLMPDQVVNLIRIEYENKRLEINNYEGFIRQIIGWREYQRYCYIYYYKDITSGNVFKNKNKLTQHWYEGTTGIEPIDKSIKFAFKYGYLHHILRLMVMGNFMNLCMISPHEVYKWFMEFSCDSYDWVMIQNVYSMALWADKGLTMSKPYITTDNYIMKMSNFNKGIWNETWRSLFYNFIWENKSIIKNTFYRSNLNYINRQTKKKRNEILKNGKVFIKEKTI